MAAPVLLLVTFGIVEFGRTLMVRNALTNASREGCRRAVLATTQDQNEVEAVISSYLDGIVLNEDVQVNISPTNFATMTSRTEVTVDLSVAYSDISWLPVASWMDGYQLRASTTQRRE